MKGLSESGGRVSIVARRDPLGWEAAFIGNPRGT